VKTINPSRTPLQRAYYSIQNATHDYIYFINFKVLRTVLPIRLSRISDPNFVHPGSEFFPSRIPDPGSASKNVSILTQKTVS
jgi:hypothetical protein